MANTAITPGQRLHLTCNDCSKGFIYLATKSNNYPMFCPECRRIRTVSNKRRFDELRMASKNITPQKDIKTVLDAIPDYIMHPTRVIDAAIRQCEGG